MKITLGFSPCPNDTFIFDALVSKKIDTHSFEFQPVLEDVQTLNEWANEPKLDVTKLSFPALFANSDKYEMLSAGAALGKGVGPLLVAKKKIDLPEISQKRIAIPGIDTTANLLLKFAFPTAKNKIPMLFSDIEDAVLNGEADLGVIIHENRFTYEKKGLIKVVDLGEFWEAKKHLPIPLGCIAVKKELPTEVKNKIAALIKESVQFAQKNYPEITDYVKQHAQAMDESLMRQHIELYVNDFTIEIGNEGKKAIENLRSVYEQLHD